MAKPNNWGSPVRKNLGSPTGMGQYGGDFADDNAEGPVPYKHFPTPKFVIDITAPAVVTVDSTALKEAWEDAVIATERSFDAPPSPSSAGSRKKKTRFKMKSLITKMINRLIREEIIPYEAVVLMSAGNAVHVRILVSSSAIPIILLRCEHIGVGNGVGACYVIPLETSLVPAALAGPTKEVSVLSFEVAPSTDAKTSKFEAKTASPGALTRSTVTADESESESVSSVEEVEDDEEGVGALPNSVLVPFLSPEQKKKLNEDILKARKEWRDTASRVRVAQVVEEVSSAAAFTPDYFAFTVCASLVAAIGLAVNSSVTVIASMLISPIMGPVMCFTFGTAVRQRPLLVKGFLNEIYSLLVCIGVGVIAGIVVAVSGVPERRDWPSDEMTSRGDPVGLISGVLVALPSGVAVSLSVLSKNSGGLVGVAISLSLLPPAVNAGICWVYELMLLSNKYDRNEGDDTDYWRDGTVSFLLTVFNIICIWIAGVATFKGKEVAPIKHKDAFWSRDLQVYRQARNSPEGADLEVINDGIKATLELQEAAAVEGETNEKLHEEKKTENVSGNDNKKESLLKNANKFGGLGEAGEALFASGLFKSSEVGDLGSESFVYSDEGIQHENVVEEVLIQDRRRSL